MNEQDWKARAEAAEARVEVLEEVVIEFIEHEVYYMRRNNLGDPEKLHRVIRGRAALSEKEKP